MGKEKMRLEKMTVEPSFDLEYFMEISGLMRVDHDLMELIERYWSDWTKALQAYRMEPTRSDGDDGFLLVYLDEDSENQVQQAFEANPHHGFAFHNLAITLVMSAAQSLMPELAGGCVPMPTPDREAKKKFKKLGLEWNETGSMNRSYAVFTPYPYRGGCEVCHSCDTCPSSTVMEIKPRPE